MEYIIYIFASKFCCSTIFPIRAIESSILSPPFDIHLGFPTSLFHWFSVTFPLNYMSFESVNCRLLICSFKSPGLNG